MGFGRVSCGGHLLSQSRAAEVALAKKRFEMSRFDLVQHLNQLETRKKHEVVERWATNRTHSRTVLFLSSLPKNVLRESESEAI